MKFNREIESFIKDYVKDLKERNAAIFAGAGLSKQAGFVNWQELLADIAEEIGLDVKIESDLLSLAQYHVNEFGGRAKINQKILEEFSEQAENTLNHEILARLPISTFWTTNYDRLVENALKQAGKVVDVKYDKDQLAVTKPRRDAVVYKMHGDVEHPAKAILTKQQYEGYYKTHEHFVTALSGDLISKTFLFLGFSFTDPNLDYVLSRLSLSFNENMRQHYTFIKNVKSESKEQDSVYEKRKQELRINDLKRYRIKALLVDDYSEITAILKEIETRFRKSTVFISGSAEQYGEWNKDNAQGFIHSLANSLISAGYTIVNGFGWGVGSAVINGALEAIYGNPEKYSQDQLIVRPFPQFETGQKKLEELWKEYRNNMIPLSGVAIFMFGNLLNDRGELINADGVMKEFEIAVANEAIPVPIFKTGFAAAQIFEKIMSEKDRYYQNQEWIIPILESFSKAESTDKDIVSGIMKILNQLNK